MNFTLSEPSAAVQLIGAGLAFAIVALIALAAKLAAVANERDDAQSAALAIQEDRDQYLKMLEIESKVSGRLKTERDRLADEVADLKAQLRHTAVTRDPKTGRMVSNKPKPKNNEQ